MAWAENSVVVGREGVRGVLESPWADDRESVVRLEDGRRIVLAAGLLKARADGAFDAPIGPIEADAGDSETRIPIVEEYAEVGKRTVETGKVRIRKSFEEREEIVDEPLWREDVEVERVAVGRMLDGPVEIRREGEMTIIPVVEEVLVVEKRLILREEIRITTRRTEGRSPQKIGLRSERVEIDRLPTDGVGPEDAKTEAL